MATIFDAHHHILPPMVGSSSFDEECLKENLYHMRFGGPGGVRRVRDNVLLDVPVLEGSGDGISYLPDVNYRVGEAGRMIFTYQGEDYYTLFLQPGATDMSSTVETVISHMDYAGVDRAIIQHDRVYGRLDDYVGEAISNYPDRVVGLAQVDEWKGGDPGQLERLHRQINDLGFSGLYFATGGFMHNDFAFGINEPILEPLWETVADLGIPIHWYATKNRRPRFENYVEELRDLNRWANAHPYIPSVLTHGLENLRIDWTDPRRFDLLPELVELIGREHWHLELMIHKMLHDHEFSPYHPEGPKLVSRLMDTFGVEKLLWGSDMPSCEMMTTYRHSRLLFESQCEFLTQDERSAILGGNLERLYPPST